MAGEILETTVSAVGYGGQGIAKPRGTVLFIPRALPGDKLKVRVKHMKKRYGTAEIVDILEPAASRINPNCHGFDNGCGGCQWLHMRYKDQLYHKGKIVRETLKRIGRINIGVKPVIAAKPHVGCRNKFSLRVDDDGTIGLCREKSHLVLDLETCKMELKANEACFQEIKKNLGGEGPDYAVNQVHIRSSTDGTSGICLFGSGKTKDYKRMWNQLSRDLPTLVGMGVKPHRRYTHIAGERKLFERLDGLEFGTPHQSFFQTHYNQALELMKIVRRFADVSPDNTVLDLFCGVGFLTLALARSCSSAHGIDIDRQAVQAARENAAVNAIDNATFSAGDATKILPDLLRTGVTKKAEIVVLDPPRAGCTRTLLERIVSLSPKRIVYASCAPDTLARDLAILAHAGFRVTECQPIDMFPQTYHIETVVKLDR